MVEKSSLSALIKLFAFKKFNGISEFFNMDADIESALASSKGNLGIGIR